MKTSNNVTLRSSTGGTTVSLIDEYDRDLLFEYLAERVRRDRWVQVCAGRERWRATLLRPDQHVPCTECGEPLTIAHTSAGHRLCTRCRRRALH